MTGASPASATGLPSDRRSLLSGAALASIVAATAAVPALASEQPGPIERAYGAWLKASLAADKACEATWEIEELYEAPERPRYHAFRSQGAHDVEIIEVTEDGRHRGRTYLCLDDENVDYLKKMIATPFDPSKSEPESVRWNRLTHERTVQEAKDTLREIEAHRAECKRRADACGLTAAREHERPLMQAMREARDALFAMKPTSYREAAFVAAILRLDWDERAACNLTIALVEIAGIPDYFEEV